MPATLPSATLLVFSGGGEGHQPAASFLGLPLVLWQSVSLVLFFALLVRFLKKPLRTYFSGRHTAIEEALQKATEDRRRADALVAEMERRLGELEGELVALRVGAGEGVEEERREILRRAEVEATRILERATAEAETRTRTARAELTAFAAGLSAELARDLLSRVLTPADQVRLVREGLDQLSARGSAPPRG